MDKKQFLKDQEELSKRELKEIIHQAEAAVDVQERKKFARKIYSLVLSAELKTESLTKAFDLYQNYSSMGDDDSFKLKAEKNYFVFIALVKEALATGLDN